MVYHSILPQAMKNGPAEIGLRGQKTKSCWTGTFLIKPCFSGKDGADWGSRRTAKPALSCQ